MSWIKINGIKSNDLGLRLIGRFNHYSSGADVSEERVLGRDGVLLTDNHRLKPVEMDYEFTVEGDSVENLEKISEWLDFVGWKDLELAWDTEHVYKATYVEDFELKEMYYQFGKLRLIFLTHPLKRLRTGLSEQSISSGMIINNPTKRASKPTFKLTGAGSMTLTVNNKTIKFKDVVDGIVIDSENRQVYWGQTTKWSNFLRTSEDDFLTLDIGNNTISFTGATSVKLIPNWSVKL